MNWILFSVKILFVAAYITGGGEVWAEGRSSATCQVPANPPKIVCEEGGVDLCVNTPPGGVREEAVLLKGRLNTGDSAPIQLLVSTQHELTHAIESVELGSPETQDCWERPLSGGGNFCLEPGGRFAVRVPLPELGPYTIFVAASRPQGEPARETVRTSRVVAPELTPDKIVSEPDIAMPGNLPVETSHVRVTVELLKDCGTNREECDFIGSSTGGVTVRVDNAMEKGKTVACSSNVIQGGAGRFTLGVPVRRGKNRLTVSVCNAATGFETGDCPRLPLSEFFVEGESLRLTLLPPFREGGNIWDPLSRPTLPFRFRLSRAPEQCDDSVQVALNAGEFRPVCAEGGVFSTDLLPEKGVNLVTVRADIGGEKISRTIPFGWGERMSPFDSSGEPLPAAQRTLRPAGRLWFSEKFLNQSLYAHFESFLNSEAFPDLLEETVALFGAGSVSEGDGAAEAGPLPDMSKRFPYCASPSGGGGLQIRFSRKPQIGSVKISPLRLSGDRATVRWDATDVVLSFLLIKDANRDGASDMDPLPLKISFSTLRIDPVLKKADGLWQLSADNTDCDYKRKGACLGLPALLTPKKFKGNASATGSFVICDGSQKISKKMERVCHGLNLLDTQTGGVFQEKVLDALNRMVACNGTAFLQKLFDGGQNMPFLEAGLGLESLDVAEGGLTVGWTSRFGTKKGLRRWPLSLRRLQPGILASPVSPAKTGLQSNTEGISADLSLALLSQVFWGVRESVTVDEDFFRARGFDFEEKCGVEEGKEIDPLCNLRPRVGEIFGRALADAGYAALEDPVKMVVSPPLEFPLDVQVLDHEGTLRVVAANWPVDFNGVIQAELSLLLTLKVEKADFSPEDPDHIRFVLKIDGEGSDVWLNEREGTNTTVLPAADLLGQLQFKLRAAIDHFSKPGNEIVLPVNRFFLFGPDSFLAKIGLDELTWGRDGFTLAWDPAGNRLLLKTVPVLRKKD